MSSFRASHLLTAMGNGYEKTDAVSSVHYYQFCIIPSLADTMNIDCYSIPLDVCVLE